MNLSSKTDATIIAIVRKVTTISTPTAKDTLQAGEAIGMTCTHKTVDDAFYLLSASPIRRIQLYQ